MGTVGPIWAQAKSLKTQKQRNDTFLNRPGLFQTAGFSGVSGEILFPAIQYLRNILANDTIYGVSTQHLVD
jgi:hypothetical protein